MTYLQAAETLHTFAIGSAALVASPVIGLLVDHFTKSNRFHQSMVEYAGRTLRFVALFLAISLLNLPLWPQILSPWPGWMSALLVWLSAANAIILAFAGGLIYAGSLASTRMDIDLISISLVVRKLPMDRSFVPIPEIAGFVDESATHKRVVAWFLSDPHRYTVETRDGALWAALTAFGVAEAVEREAKHAAALASMRGEN